MKKAIVVLVIMVLALTGALAYEMFGKNMIVGTQTKNESNNKGSIIRVIVENESYYLLYEDGSYGITGEQSELSSEITKRNGVACGIEDGELVMVSGGAVNRIAIPKQGSIIF